MPEDELPPLHVGDHVTDRDSDDLIGADCPVCGEEMTPGAIRFNGRAWEHKSDETHPQAGHHRISEPLDEDDEEQLRADGGRPTEEEMLDVELVLGAGRLDDHQVRLDVSAAKVVNREEGRLEISLADGELAEYLAELGLKNRTDEIATDGGQLTQRQQRQAKKLELKHAAEQGREQRLQTALETGEVGKQGQRIWIIPEFEPDEAESDLIQDSVREALPEYDCQVVDDRTKPITKDRIHDMLLGSGEEDDVRTDGGRSAGNPETRLGEARKQLRILLDDVEFEDEDTAEYVAGALACAESAAVCLEGPEVLEDRSGGSDA